MPYDDDDDSATESGGQLRKKLEDALKSNSALTSQLAGFQAEKLVAEKGFTLVKPEDLKGVELDKLEERATALQAERTELQANLLRDAFKRQGYEGESLDRQLAVALGTAESGQAAAGLSTGRQLGSVGGTVVPQIDERQLTPLGKIEAGIVANRKKA